jgi:hypothetical protein
MVDVRCAWFSPTPTYLDTAYDTPQAMYFVRFYYFNTLDSLGAPITSSVAPTTPSCSPVASCILSHRFVSSHLTRLLLHQPCCHRRVASSPHCLTSHLSHRCRLSRYIIHRVALLRHAVASSRHVVESSCSIASYAVVIVPPPSQ